LQLGRFWPIEIGQMRRKNRTCRPSAAAAFPELNPPFAVMGSSERVARPAHYQQLSCGGNGGENGGAEAKTRTENITIRSSPARKGEPLAAPQAQP